MMKDQLFAYLIGILMLSITTMAGQSGVSIDEAFQKEAIETLSQLILDNYVYEEVAKKTVAHLNRESTIDSFKELKNLKSFAEALTKEVQSINNDKHMRIRPARPRKAPEKTPERVIEDQLHRNEESREHMAGFKSIQRLDGNVGYLEIFGFAGVSIGAPAADRYMYLLATADAIIIDLRKNGGGDPAMVQYLCSYFFDQKVHLNSLYWREGDTTEEFWTLAQVGGQKLPDVPLFVLTSPRTFSGAEEFAYNMQTRKRATLVGETTGGGANPGGIFRINSQLSAFIPTGAAINPITKTNWEGVGVVPEVKTSKDEAYDKALALATEAAKEYRLKNRAKHNALLTKLTQVLSKLDQNSTTEQTIKQLKTCHQAGILKEWHINRLGYEYLQEFNNGLAAEALFKGNTLLYPESPNVFDSYGEALAANGKMKEAIASYEKAVSVAKEKNDPNISAYQENLNKVKQNAKKE